MTPTCSLNHNFVRSLYAQYKYRPLFTWNPCKLLEFVSKTLSLIYYHRIKIKIKSNIKACILFSRCSLTKKNIVKLLMYFAIWSKYPPPSPDLGSHEFHNHLIFIVLMKLRRLWLIEKFIWFLHQRKPYFDFI